MIERLALGTVQFGLPYGIANRTGKPTLDESTRIVQRARAAGMNTLDTAVAYGDSERRLGEIGASEWRVVTKLPPIPESVRDVGSWVRETVDASLERLRLASVAGLLLHRSSDLLGANGRALVSALRRERNEGRAAKIGVSIYDPGELDAIWNALRPDIVQAPFNALDRRLESSGWLARLGDEGVELHTRSAFLQGLLLMPPDVRPRAFDRWSAVWEAWAAWLDASEMCAVRAALAHVLSYSEITRVVVGVESTDQLAEILAATSVSARAPSDVGCQDTDLIEPSRWSKL